jgi:hypothetical protein
LFILIVAVFLYYSFFKIEAQFICLPLLCLVVAAGSAWNLARGRNPARQSLIMAVSLFSFLVLVRMVFHVWAGHYGFYLIVPGLIMYYFFFLRFLPSLFRDSSIRLFITGGFIVLNILCIVTYVKIGFYHYAQRSLKVTTPHGTMIFPNEEPFLSCIQFMEYIERSVKPGETMSVFPEGVGLNFLTGLRNPLTYYYYDPLSMGVPGVTAHVIDQLDREKVTYAVLLQRDMSGYGSSSFGRDYATDIMSYINANYILLKQWGPFPYTSQQFGIALFKRKSDEPVIKVQKTLGDGFKF